MSKNAPSTSSALLVQAEAAPGFAASHNNQPANFLIVVTNPVTGEAVTDLVLLDRHRTCPPRVSGGDL
jgi:hypothetical protein